MSTMQADPGPVQEPPTQDPVVHSAQLPPEQAPSARRARLPLLLGAIPLTIYILAAVIGPILVPYHSVQTHVTDRLKAPGSILGDGSRAWLGTDQVGHDVLAQVISGARISMLVGLVTVVVAGVLGSLLGLAAGYAGGWFDSLVMRIADVQLAFPSILLAILIAAVIGPSVTNVIFTLAITKWVIFARVARASALALRERDYVDAARVLGASRWQILTGDILPGALGPLLVLATSQFGLVIVAEASLSYLGLGTPQSTPSWGLTIAQGRDVLATAWWISTIPGIALALLVLCISIYGDRIRDYLDPTGVRR
jgi:peptide/nickel transport system permease protein